MRLTWALIILCIFSLPVQAGWQFTYGYYFYDDLLFSLRERGHLGEITWDYQGRFYFSLPLASMESWEGKGQSLGPLRLTYWPGPWGLYFSYPDELGALWRGHWLRDPLLFSAQAQLGSKLGEDWRGEGEVGFHLALNSLAALGQHLHWDGQGFSFQPSIHLVGERWEYQVRLHLPLGRPQQGSTLYISLLSTGSRNRGRVGE
ncbi:MAG: hypothetical protein ACOYD6_09780 [Limnochordia bacterium]|jgi:hypothetical protein